MAKVSADNTGYMTGTQFGDDKFDDQTKRGLDVSKAEINGALFTTLIDFSTTALNRAQEAGISVHGPLPANTLRRVDILTGGELDGFLTLELKLEDDSVRYLPFANSVVLDGICHEKLKSVNLINLGTHDFTTGSLFIFGYGLVSPIS